MADGTRTVTNVMVGMKNIIMFAIPIHSPTPIRAIINTNSNITAIKKICLSMNIVDKMMQ